MKNYTVLAFALTLAGSSSFAGEQIVCAGKSIRFDLLAKNGLPDQTRTVIQRGPEDVRVQLAAPPTQTTEGKRFLYQSYDEGPTMHAELSENGNGFKLSVFENDQLLEDIDCLYQRNPLPRIITEACKPGGGIFTAFLGAYTMHLQIGHHVFQDQLLITSMSRSPGMLNFKEALRGKFTVPGVFQSNLYDGVAQGFEEVQVFFRIEANENGRTYPVFFQATAEKPDLCRVKGQALTLKPGSDSEKEMMGTFTLTKNTPDCSCRL